MKIKLNFTLASLAVLLGFVPITYSQSTSEDIDDYLNYCHQNNMFNGSVLVALDNEILYQQGFGYCDSEQTSEIKPTTSFYLCSVSKQFTAMGIMLLKKNGNLTYNDKISKFFPNLPDFANDITIKHLLTHTSGIPDYFNSIYKPGLTNQNVFEFIMNLDSLNFTPEDKFSYSNSGYVLLSLIIEEVSKMTYAEFLDENIFSPLAMTSTLAYEVSTPKIENRAIGYTPSGDLSDYDILTTGDGGLFSTVEDLYKWDRALYTEKLVAQEMIEEAFSAIKLSNGSVSNYGYGWGVQRDSTTNRVEHSGSLAGFRTIISRDLDSKFVCILLTNHGNQLDLFQTVEDLRTIANGTKWEYPKVSILTKLIDVMNAQGIDSTIRFYKEFKDDHDPKYSFEENQLNSFGYWLGNEGMPTEAQIIFQLNIEQFPAAFNVYDSYAESCFYLEQYELSKENYMKSLEINPENGNAINMIGRIKKKIANNE
ncbi:MAG: CubicO group peptidase (beta-lactamase class C family) [Ulvibacter sp.]|jgi:CubicO group peptidase (beta-lactamase class C family)